MKRYFFIPLILSVLLSSCGSYKDIPYFQDLNRQSVVKEAIDNYSPFTIQQGDMLEINVTSENAESSKFLQPAASENDNNSSSAPTYLVDKTGNIQLPVVGQISVKGLTIAQAHDLLVTKLSTYIKDFTLKVKITNFKFTVVGDVEHPGVFTSPNDKLNLIEALGYAGDLSITAKRRNLLLIREIGGNREFVTIDLTTSQLFHSPYYYLKNNDMIYVQPDKAKYNSVSTARENLTLGISLLSIAALLLEIYRR
jgi:polysaccharide export outer membrane protein